MEKWKAGEEKMKKYLKFNCLETIFKSIYIVHLLLAFNALVNRTVLTTITSAIVLVLGCLVMIGKIFTVPGYLKRKNVIVLNLFLVSYLISTFVNMEFGAVASLKGFIWLVLQIWILYLISEETDVKKEFWIIGNIYVMVTSIQNLIGFLMFLGGYAYRNVSPEGEIHMLGFMWNRLWGVYDDPNHGAIITAAAILITLGLYRCAKKKYIKILYRISLFVQFSYIILSDSRTGVICFAVGVALLYLIRYLYTRKQINVKTIVKAAIVSFLGIFLFLGLVTPIQRGYAFVGKYTAGLVKNVEKQPGKDDDDLEVGREEMSSDPSNRRFDIWRSGVEIFSSSPVVGTGWSNLNPYAHKYLPDTYIVDNDYKEFVSLHNIFFDVLAGQGLIGISIFVILILNSVVFTIKWFKKLKKEEYDFMAVMFSILVIMLFASLLISFVFYVNSPESFVFWFIFGYFMFTLQKAKTRTNLN